MIVTAFPFHDDLLEFTALVQIDVSLSIRQITIIEAIPEDHQPIFWFLKYHLRRPAEACTLKKGKRYTGKSLNRIWKAACKKTGEDIDLYSGLKHSSCSQFINESGMAISDLQTITDHARSDSVRRYSKTEVARKKALFESGENLKNLLRLVK